MRGMLILTPGLQTTVQDSGRWGFQGSGVPVAGPMDLYAHRIANVLVGNPIDAAALEVTLAGPEIECQVPRAVAVAGAEFELDVDGTPQVVNCCFHLRAGARLRFGRRRRGARAYLAVRGGIDVAPVLGSRSTSLSSRMGGLEGRVLRRGDVLPLGDGRPGRSTGANYDVESDLPDGHADLRILPGPHLEHFDDEALERLESNRYVLMLESSRMAFRLNGPPVGHATTPDILSDVTPLGAVQVPASGQPILLMADRQTTGGYAIVAIVISADIGRAGQLAPGDSLRFRICSRQQAAAALIERERRLLRLIDATRAGPTA